MKQMQNRMKKKKENKDNRLKKKRNSGCNEKS